MLTAPSMLKLQWVLFRSEEDVWEVRGCPDITSAAGGGGNPVTRVSDMSGGRVDQKQIPSSLLPQSMFLTAVTPMGIPACVQWMTLEY